MILLFLEAKELAIEIKIGRYQELKREIKRMWTIRSIKVIRVVVEALGSTSEKPKKCIKNWELLQAQDYCRKQFAY